MPITKLTARTVESAKKGDRLFIIYDSELPGFGLRVMPSGFKSWIVEYRPKGAGRSVGKRRLTLGPASVVTATKARALAKDALAAVRHGHDPLAERQHQRAAISISDLAERFYAEHVNRKRKVTTAALYRRALDYIKAAVGNKKAMAVERADILRLHGDLHATPVMANRVLAVASSMYTWAAKNGLVAEGFNPASRIDKNSESGRERFLTAGELERLGATLQLAETEGLPWNIKADGARAKHLAAEARRRTTVSPYAVAAIRLLLLTGCRLREILHLRWSEVDFERGMLHFADSKTGRKSVVLNAPALAVLNHVPRIGEFVIAGRPPAKPGDPERPRSDLKKPWAAIRRAAELDGVRIHDLRHSFASVGAGAGLGLPIVGKLLGHTQAATTQKYAHLDNDPLRRASNTIGATIAAALAARPAAEPVILSAANVNPKSSASGSRG